ncbi:MAG: hypothetical protein QM484_08905 [Woeseiaceae bacterium]
MKLSKAREPAVTKLLVKAELLRNPSKQTEWFIMLHKQSGNSFMLVNDDDSPILASDIEQLFPILKSMGFGQVTVNI